MTITGATERAHLAKDGKIAENVAALAQQLAALRDGRKVVHCHGVFDLLHIGHIKHLQQARQLGDLLVVTITPDRFVNKGPHRPVFKERLRAEALASLACVDFVAINDWPRATETIQALRPDVFVKGSEYKELKDFSGAVAEEEQTVRAVGGRIAFTEDITFSSSSLINRHLSQFPPAVRDFLAGFAGRHEIDAVLGYLKNAQDLTVAVVGEAIIDEYRYCDAIGKSSKEPMLAVRQEAVESFAGGILAVANHLAAFCKQVRLVTALGQDCPWESFIRGHLAENIEPKWICRADAPTIVKRRYIDRYFFQKLFCVYEMKDQPVTGEAEERLLAQLRQALAGADLCVVVDFGHGLLTEASIGVLAAEAKFLVVNAQSNAGNLGFHSIGRYPRADLVCITENELRMEARERHGPLLPLLEGLAARMNCRQAAITRGAKGCLVLDRAGGLAEVPAVAGEVRDRMGAGDTFLAMASLCAAQGAPGEVLGLIGNAAGAEAVATVGHRRSLDKPSLLKHIECLLK
ncbi:MAG: adenylyltransferase/cytidyltransferase family protein [Phycisphaeraceae bacterium]|nr:adenylyltransferase/cytidyltransferase family protein [Phycisphaeraceae bacterium]